MCTHYFALACTPPSILRRTARIAAWTISTAQMAWTITNEPGARWFEAPGVRVDAFPDATLVIRLATAMYVVNLCDIDKAGKSRVIVGEYKYGDTEYEPTLLVRTGGPSSTSRFVSGGGTSNRIEAHLPLKDDAAEAFLEWITQLTRQAHANNYTLPKP